MIMVSGMTTMNNVTERSIPAWMHADNYGALLLQDGREKSLLQRIYSLLKAER